VSTDLVISNVGGSDEDLLDVLARDRSATGSSDSENPFDTLWRDFE